MKKYYNPPNGTVIFGFILLNVLAGILYRYNELFQTTTYLYLWLSLFVLGTVILILGFKSHFAAFHR